MKDHRIRDFISTYQPPKVSEPFFGFFEMPKTREERSLKNKIKKNGKI